MVSARTVICTLVLFIVGIGIGIGIGYGAFNKRQEKSMESSTQATAESQTYTTRSSTTATTTTESSSITTTTFTSTITETIPPAVTCPPVLTSPYTTRQLVKLNQTTVSINFQRFLYAFVSPAGVSQAMIAFEFITEWGSWYLDDVSITSTYNPSNNLLDNGGFESGVLGSQWKFCDTRFSWFTEGSVVSQTHNFGNYSYESKKLDTGSDEYLTQAFNIEGNGEYDIQFYLAIDGSPTSATVFIMMH